ncbi:MAG TPA: organomercurial lyase [Gemmatimonadaceae bacterium]|nr:organomercurial lyase [Gemmatimonadaceae bacterium]
MPNDVTPAALRVFIYDHVVAAGLPPTNAEIGEHFGMSAGGARAAIASLDIGKTILPHPDTGEIWMAGPFASRPSDYRVHGSRVSWWANCAWDMLGVARLAREPVRVDTQCTDCGEPITFEVDPERGVIGGAHGLVVHFLVPAKRWYDDIGFT